MSHQQEKPPPSAGLRQSSQRSHHSPERCPFTDLWREALRHSTYGKFLIQADGTVLDFNHQAREIGRRLGQVEIAAGEPLTDLLPTVHRDGFQKNLNQVVRDHCELEYISEIAVDGKNSHFWFRFFPLGPAPADLRPADQNESIIFFSMRDVSELELERRRNQARERKLLDIALFTSHDIGGHVANLAGLMELWDGSEEIKAENNALLKGIRDEIALLEEKYYRLVRRIDSGAQHSPNSF